VIVYRVSAGLISVEELLLGPFKGQGNAWKVFVAEELPEVPEHHKFFLKTLIATELDKP
jgi:hypothetical protein